MTTSTWRCIALLGAAALGGVSAGCSFIFTETVPSEHAKLAYFDCTSTYGLAVADGVIGLSGALGAGMTLSQSKQEYADKNSGASRNAAAGVDIALAGLLAGSAVYGAVQAMRCDRAKDELKARIFAPRLRPPLPPALLPGAVPSPATSPSPGSSFLPSPSLPPSPGPPLLPPPLPGSPLPLPASPVPSPPTP